MKKRIVLAASLLLSCHCNADDLMGVFREALAHDNVYQEALLKTLAYREDIAISRADLLLNAHLELQPSADKQYSYGAIVPEIEPPRNTFRSYEMRLSITQPIFNFRSFSRYKTAKIAAREAVARLNSELQDLILRVTDAYFNVLRSEKRVSYLHAHKKALAKQLYDVEQKYKIGKTTRSYVYVAKSSYSAAESDLISAEAQLASDREYLTQITSFEYTSLADLRNKIPLISPQPANIEKWVHKALTGNWIVKANQLKLQASREKIKQNYGDHLPTVNAKLLYDDNAFHYSEGSVIVAAGSSRVRNAGAFLNVNIPIYAGGLAVASARKAKYNFRIDQQKLEHSVREVTYETRKSYRNVSANIKKIRYASDAIQSAQSSLEGLRQRYVSGAGSLTDVLAQQTQLLDAQMQYESARYDYIINLLRLKKEAGTLSANDLFVVNQWLQHG
ncbi:TolC family outer membrane protein [Legionella saoudiensis]|uniref:TolC family outer membrane protein n=1 Tax=Legionella saoudiensis TaxID=1750561 RepID=UPI0007318655|nr:TolC family outer membrane protein [Legionella saoudiensis]